MGYARAMAAGVLLTVLAVELVTATNITERESVLWMVMLGLVVLLIIPDLLEQWARSRKK